MPVPWPPQVWCRVRPRTKNSSIVAAMSRFAGRRLEMDNDIYESEAATNDRNRGIAHLLDGYGRMYCDPNLATDVYTRQCSVRVSARDLAVMGATLANGGVNPITGEQAIDTRYCKRVLAVLATAGLYEHSGQWLYDVGLPGKSGVAGGIVTVSPGRGASARSPRRSMRQATACGGNASPGTSQKRWGSTCLPRLLLPDTPRNQSLGGNPATAYRPGRAVPSMAVLRPGCSSADDRGIIPAALGPATACRARR